LVVAALGVLLLTGTQVAWAEPQVKLFDQEGNEVADGRIEVYVGQTFELTVKLTEQPDSTVYFTMHTGTTRQGSPISLQGGSDAFDSWSRADKRTTVYFKLDQSNWNSGARLLMHGERERSGYWQLSFRGGANPPALFVKGLPPNPANSPPEFGVSIADAKTVEGSPLNFKLTLNSAAPSGGLEIGYKTVQDTAGHLDYERSWNSDTLKEDASITVPEGATEAVIKVQTKRDTENESSEKMGVVITVPDGWEGVRTQAVGTIEDRPPATVSLPGFLGDRQIRLEEDGQGISLNFTVDHPHSGEIEVEWWMDGLDPGNRGRAAPADFDFGGMTAKGGTVAIKDASKGIGTLRINADTSRATVFIPIVTNDGCEHNEDARIRFKITQGLAKRGWSHKEFRINHPSCPTLSISDQSPRTITEGGTGTFTVKLDPPPANNLTINYSFPGLRPANYHTKASDLPAGGSFVYPANAESYSLEITPVDDNIRESSVEIYKVQLSVAGNTVRLQDGGGQGRIQDGPQGDAISLLHGGSVKEGEDITLTVTSFERSEPDNKAGPTTVKWSLWHPKSKYNNHTDGNDLADGQVPNGVVNIDPNTLTGTIVISTKADAIAEGTERIVVSIQPDAQYNYRHFGGLTRTIHIQDSEYEQIEIEHRNGPSRIYPQLGADYQLRLKQAPSQDVQVKVGFQDTHFNVSPDTLTFTTTNWNGWQSVEVTVRRPTLKTETHTFSHRIVPIMNTDGNYIITKRTADTDYRLVLEVPTFNLGTISNANLNEGQSHTYNLNVTGSLLSDITVSPELEVTRGTLQTSPSDLGIDLAGSDTGRTKTVKQAEDDPSRKFGFTLTKGTDDDHLDTRVDIKHAVTESAASATTASATIRFRDPDQPGITVTPPSGVTGSGTLGDPYILDEGSSYDFGLKLKTNPLQDVQLRASSNVPLMSLTAGALLNGDTQESDRKTLLPAPSDHSPNQITDWTQTHQLRLTTVTDPNSVTESGKVTLSVQHYDKSGRGFFNQDVYVKITDNSSLGVLFGSGTGNDGLSIAEGNDGNFTAILREGDTKKYKVRLGSDPGNGNTVTVTPTSNLSSVTTSGALEFTGGTNGNWMVVQEIELTARLDHTANHRQATITHAVVGYTGVSAAPSVKVAVPNHAGAPTITLNETDRSARMDDTFSYTISISRPDPGTTATITVTNPDPAKVKIWTGNTEPANSAGALSLSFQNSSRHQTVNVKVLTNAAATVALTHAVSGYTIYGLAVTGLTIPDYTVTTLETKTIDLEYLGGDTPPTLQLIEGNVYAIYWVRLKADPEGSVTLSLHRSDNSHFTVAPGSLSFDSSNWQRYRMVTVKPLDDSGTTDKTETITHQVPTGWKFSASTNPAVPVNITDDD